MRRAATVLAVGFIASLLLAGAARADTPPSVWDTARDPREAGRWALHVSAQRLMQGRPDSPPDEEKLRVEAARALLEDADAAHSPDVRLRFDLGNAYSELELQSEVVDVLAPALAMAPDHPASTTALEKLAYAYAKLGRSREELEVWRRYVPRLDDRARALEMMNMGEAEMRLGYLDDALATFREGLQLCGELPNFGGVAVTYALTLWDLAVALDRSGDLRGARDTAAKAMAVTWQETLVLPGVPGSPQMVRKTVTGAQAIENTTTVFFVPEWERDWYLALEAEVGARAAHDSLDAADFWRVAEGHREAYVAGASGSAGPDPWLPVAKRRLEQVHAEVVAASKRAPKGPRPRLGGT